MSTEQRSFMQRLDDWTDEAIIERLAQDAGAVIGVELQLQIRRAIREKVLESYRNGQAVRPHGRPRAGQERRSMAYGR